LHLITLFDTHTHTVGRAALDEGSARRADLYLTIRNTPEEKTSMPPAAFELAIPISEKPQTHALERVAIRIGFHICYP
jgi:hypothetical protein